MSDPRWLAVHPGFARLSVGVLEGDQWVWKDSAPGAVLNGLFPLLDRLKLETGLTPSEMEGVLLQRGPAPALGLRVACSFYRTLRVVGGAGDLWSYSSLELAAARLLLEGEPPPLRVWAPVGRGHWRVLPVATAEPPWSEEQSDEGPRESRDVVLEHPRIEPAGVRVVPDDLDALARARVRYPALFRRGMGAWEKVALSTASYRRWEGERHGKEPSPH